MNTDAHELDSLRRMLASIGYSMDEAESSDDGWGDTRASRAPRPAPASEATPDAPQERPRSAEGL